MDNWKRLSVGIVLAMSAATASTALSAGEWATLTVEGQKEAFIGNTIKESNGRWSVFYAPDGRKLVKVNDEITERKWWLDDQGRLCQTMFRDSSKSECGPGKGRQIDGDRVRYRTTMGTRWLAKVVKGNADSM